MRLLAEAGIDRLREKGVALTSFLIDLHDAWLAEMGFAWALPVTRDERLPVALDIPRPESCALR